MPLPFSFLSTSVISLPLSLFSLPFFGSSVLRHGRQRVLHLVVPAADMAPSPPSSRESVAGVLLRHGRRQALHLVVPTGRRDSLAAVVEEIGGVHAT
uniref:Uncharacterized protein n=1 Tax=Oryza glumipatula TaxID=40148 RepID=A0A0E0AUL5_9ORYZ